MTARRPTALEGDAPASNLTLTLTLTAFSRSLTLTLLSCSRPGVRPTFRP